MAVSLTTYMNSKLKAMGKTASQAKKNAGKYKSIAAAKKAGSLYYTDKNGKVMAAVYAEDLKKPLPKKAAPKKSLRPKARPVPPKGIEVKNLVKGGRGDGRSEMFQRTADRVAKDGPKAKEYIKNKNVNVGKLPSFKQVENLTMKQRKELGLPAGGFTNEKAYNRFAATLKLQKK